MLSIDFWVRHSFWVYYVACVVLMTLGVKLLFFPSIKAAVTARVGKSRVKVRVIQDKSDDVLGGFKKKFIKGYSVARFVVLGFLVIAALRSGAGSTGLVVWMVFAGVWYLFSSIRFRIGNFSLFSMIYGFVFSDRTAGMNNEIFRCALQLRNLAKAQFGGVDSVGDSDDMFGFGGTRGQESNRGLQSLVILERLTRFSNLLKPVFSQMQTYWQVGNEREACEFFERTIDTKYATEFAAILAKLSLLSLDELVDQLNLFIEIMREEKATAVYSKQGARSILMYIPAVGGTFIVLWNLLMIVVNGSVLSKLSF